MRFGATLDSRARRSDGLCRARSHPAQRITAPAFGTWDMTAFRAAELRCFACGVRCKLTRLATA